MRFLKLQRWNWGSINKVLICTLGALLVTLGLFYFMSLLIASTVDLTKKDQLSGIVEFIRHKPRSFLDEKKRKLPQKKQKQIKPPRLKPLSSTLSRTQKKLVKMDKIDLKAALKGQGPALGGVGMSSSGGTPLVRLEPQYPRKAAQQGIEGWVQLQFNISPTGNVTHVRVLNSHPPRIFDKAAMRALRKWKYRPLIEDGKPVEQKGETVQLIFELDK